MGDAEIDRIYGLLISVNGLRYPWNCLQLLLRARRRPECLAVKSVLVPPEYWDTGVAVLLMDELTRRSAAKGYRWADLSLISDDTPRTPILLSAWAPGSTNVIAPITSG